MRGETHTISYYSRVRSVRMRAHEVRGRLSLRDALPSPGRLATGTLTHTGETHTAKGQPPSSAVTGAHTCEGGDHGTIR
jgi:hypothetical protein